MGMSFPQKKQATSGKFVFQMQSFTSAGEPILCVIPLSTSTSLLVTGPFSHQLCTYTCSKVSPILKNILCSPLCSTLNSFFPFSYTSHNSSPYSLTVSSSSFPIHCSTYQNLVSVPTTKKTKTKTKTTLATLAKITKRLNQ